ncbi:uncharacterized protein LOC144435707 [Glandiceps talaboti]
MRIHVPRGIARGKTGLFIYCVLFIFLACYTEYFEFLWQRVSWKFTDVPPGMELDHPDNIKVLFVADPQLQGVVNEPRFPFGTITRWDSDFYLQKTFELALYFFEPDVVVFLGDLLDEGSIASDEAYLTYKRRFFKNIFTIPKHMNVKMLFLPGDNDIGGENNDHITETKVKRFEEHFGTMSEVVTYKYADFLKVNLVPWMPFRNVASENVFRERLDQDLEELVLLSDNRVRILLAHPKLSSVKVSRKAELLIRLKPQYAFTAHFHHESYLEHDVDNLAKRFEALYPDQRPKSRIQGMNPQTKEFSVPTCSYRMGEKEMAYGAAIIDINGRMAYTLLWLPLRYDQLYRYLVFIAIPISYYLLKWIAKKKPRFRR